MKTYRINMIYTLLVALCLVSFGGAVGYAQEAEYPSDKRIKILRYDPSDIYTIYTLYGYQTNVEFSEREVIRTISVGDRSLWQIVPAGHRLFIRPMDDSVTTNMTVITDRRTYYFDLKSGRGELRRNPLMVYVARFTYPEEQKPARPAAVQMPAPAVSLDRPVGQQPASKPLMSLPPAAPIKTVTPAPASYASRNYRYTYTGFDPLAPTEIYDDGVRTYMRFANPPVPMPKLFAVEGVERVPVKYHLAGDFMVMDSVHPRLLLDYGKGTDGQINLYNEALIPAGM